VTFPSGSRRNLKKVGQELDSVIYGLLRFGIARSPKETPDGFEVEEDPIPRSEYREHPQRTHYGKPDRYFTIYYKFKGKLHEEALGWSSEGWNAQKASIESGKLKQTHALGEGPATLAEKRKIQEENLAAERHKKEQEEKDSLTFGRFFLETYFSQAKANKSEKSYRREEQLFNLWIAPVIGQVPLKDVSPIHLE
jgi:hypothetical protein